LGDCSLGEVVADGAGKAIGFIATAGNISISPSWAVGGCQGPREKILSFGTLEFGLGDIGLGKSWSTADNTWWAVDAFTDNHEVGAGTVGPSWTSYLLVDSHRAIIAKGIVKRFLV
jgi:hypothetical protein